MRARHDDILNRLLASFSLRGLLLHPATLFVFASLGVIGGAIHLWNGHRNLIVDHEHFRLTADKIELNPQPDWCENDLKTMLLENVATGENASLLDPSLIARTVDLCKTVGWVESIRHIEKSSAGLKVDLSYRGAVGMVELNHLTVPDWSPRKSGKLLPVDRHGIIMPGKLVAEQKLLRFSIFNPTRFTKLENWTEWPDQRVLSAAKIAEALQADWQNLGLYRIVTFQKQGQDTSQSVPFELWPDHGTQIVWGNPPGAEAVGEISSSEKIELLKKFVLEYGPFNQLADARIDIRSGRIISVGGFKTARLESLNKTQK